MDKFAVFTKLFADYPKPQAEMSLQDKDEKKAGPDGTRLFLPVRLASLTPARHILPSSARPAAIWYRSGASAAPPDG